MNLLPALHCFAREDNSRCNVRARTELTAQLFNNRERWIIFAVCDEDYFVSRIVLTKERREIFTQALIESATGSDDRSIRREVLFISYSLAPYVREITRAALKRDDRLNYKQRSEEVEDQHRVKTLECGGTRCRFGLALIYS